MKGSSMNGSDDFSRTKELLGVDSGDAQAYRTRLMIVDTIASITNRKYLSDILRVSVSALCKQNRDIDEKTVNKKDPGG
ncbi:MAG: hypothetical protein IJI65_02540 [Lachnospiraceae bacterium]|nr:hypothetical protein [Lachnospiraceae bacterium]